MVIGLGINEIRTETNICNVKCNKNNYSTSLSAIRYFMEHLRAILTTAVGLGQFCF